MLISGNFSPRSLSITLELRMPCSCQHSKHPTVLETGSEGEGSRWLDERFLWFSHLPKRGLDGCWTKNRGGIFPLIFIHLLIGVFPYFHHPFWGITIFGNIQMFVRINLSKEGHSPTLYHFATNLLSGWWFQPIWKILVKLEIFLK